MEQQYANAKEFILDKFTQLGDYDFLPQGMLEKMVDKLIALDEAYMETSGVMEGEAYDDDAAADVIFAGMQEAFPEYKMYAMRLTDDYLDYNEEYLDVTGQIEWD